MQLINSILPSIKLKIQKMIVLKYIESLDTEHFLQDLLPGLDTTEIDLYVSQCGKILQKFSIDYQERSWTVLKNHIQIQNFILLFNLHFSKKVTFGNFALKDIQQVASTPNIQSWAVFIDFFEIQDLEYEKMKSVKMIKKEGGRYHQNFCCKLAWQWKRKDFVITKHSILYYNHHNSEKQIKEYIPFNANFKLICGKEQTSYDLGILLESNHRKLLIVAQEIFDYVMFIHFVRQAQAKYAQQTVNNRYDSFAAPTEKNNVSFLIDGKEYFQKLADQLEKAEKQIFIAGWMVSPEFHLKRPISSNEHYRLDRLLKRVTSKHKNLKVTIIVYQQSSFLANDSEYTKITLESISSNITVLKHPLGILPSFWSRHEKIVVIDQKVAFMGGLDLTYGRWDTSDHKIDEQSSQLYPGIEYNNLKRADILNVRDVTESSVSRSECPRLPWHDVGLKLEGESVHDLCRHFIQCWNYASFQSHNEKRYVLILDKNRRPKTKMEQIEENLKKKITQFKRYATRIFKKEEKQEQKNQVTEKEIQTQKHSEKPISSASTDMNIMLREDQININILEKKEEGSSNSSEEEEEKGKSKCKVMVKKTINEIDDIVYNMNDDIDQIDYLNEEPQSKRRKISPIVEQRCKSLDANLYKKNQQAMEKEEQMEKCQILRSVCSWSCGCKADTKQLSIQNAYIDLIKNSKRFIYIENQFFITATQYTGPIKNKIGKALYERIRRAIQQNTPFKIFVLIPLLPGFAGEIGSAEFILGRMIMHWQYHTISRGEDSLFSRISKLGVNPSTYISFYSLRTHGVVGQPKTQILYIHTKMMIVDDQKMICGSANINDRSMRGSRDSEIAVLVENGATVKRKNGGKIEIVSEKIHELRVKLFMEHFALTRQQAEDPLNPQLLEDMQFIAQKNTKIYRTVFGCYPDNNMKTFSDITAMSKEKVEMKDYQLLKKDLRGNAVVYPLGFLEDEDLLDGATLYPNSLSV